MYSNSPNQFLSEAVQAIIADNRTEARNNIESFLLENGDSAEAWLVQAWTADSLADSEEAINRALDLDPENNIAIAGLSWISGLHTLAERQIETDRQAELERLEAERLEAERLEQERLEQEHLEAERLEQERLEAERLEAERLEAERLEQERLEQERLAAEEAERLEQERLEAESLEQERLAAEEAERLEQERLAAEEARLLEVERLEQELLDAEQAGSEHQLAAEVASMDVEADLQQTIEGLADEVREEVRNEAVSSDDLPPLQGDRQYVVLAVDDSPTIRKLVSLTLEEQGFEVISASDGIEALNILADQLPDLILSDINMPRLGGYKLCKFIKKHERTASIPVVMLSGKDGVFDKMRGKMSGCDDFISKPFEAAELVAKVREHIAVTHSR